MRGLIGLFLALSCAAVAAQPPSLKDFLRPPRYESLTISPRGDYFAARVPMDERTVLVVVRRKDMEITATLDPGKEGFVESEVWVSDTLLFASVSKRFGTLEQPYRLGALYSMDVDGDNRHSFYGNLIDVLDSDPDHVLVSDCRKVVAGNCESRVRKVRNDGRGNRETVVDAPVPNARFLTDRTGRVRFSWSFDDADRQQLFLRRDGGWVPINDEAETGIEAVPVGTSYDGKFGFLWSERRDGPDVIERIELESGDRVVVASDPAFDPQALTWSFDGHEPIGAVYGGAHPRTRFFDPDHPHAKLTAQLEAAFPEEWARVTSSSRDGRTAVVTISSDTAPARYHLLDITTGDMKLLARSRPWLRAAQMSPVRPVRFRARDGLELHGWLTTPRRGQSPWALVVMPHGGPFGVSDGWLYDPEVQMLAARGYAVVQVNFRGSGGRGRAFVERGYRQWGRAMQDDVTDATRWAISEADVDPKRICIWGASYGGYAALMGAVREPDLYRCAIGMAGPYHLPTLHAWGDVHRSDWGEAYLERTVGDDRAELLKLSPTTHVDKIQANIMLVQGMRDERVSPEHVRAMKRALEEVGKPYEGFFPSEETHGFYGRENRREYYRRVLDFLDRNIGAGSPD